MKSKHIGSSYGDFLKEEGIYEEETGHAIKRVIAWQLAKAMMAKNISKAEMARRLKSSRTQVTRLLDPENCSVQLDTMQRAAAIVGKCLVIKLEDIPRSATASTTARRKKIRSAINETRRELDKPMKKLAE
jgi:antitoxin HicB